MIKRALHVALLIALTIGAGYSYDQVDFGERTAEFFRTAFAEEGAARRGRGHGGFEERGRDMRRGRESGDARGEARERTEAVRDRFERRRPAREAVGDSRDRTDAPPVDRQWTRERSSEFRGSGGRDRRGTAISLEEVGYYSIIFAFATMLTYSIDGLVKRAVRARRMAASGWPGITDRRAIAPRQPPLLPPMHPDSGVSSESSGHVE